MQAQSSDDAASNDMTAKTFAEKFQEQVVKGSEVHGRVGVYDFRRWHDTNQPYPGQPDTDDDFNTQGTNYGAQIGIQTGRIYGFSAGAEFVYSDSFYGDNDDNTKLNCNLACNGAISNITQGYLQFNAYGAQIRGGRQLLNTPLAGADQFTFLPRSFNGVSAVVRPLQMIKRLSYSPGDLAQGDATDQSEYGPQITQSRVADNQNYETDQYLPFAFGAKSMDMPEWQIFGAKIGRYEGRGNADEFVTDNRYFTDVDGFWSVGTTFRNVTEKGQIIGQYYHYRFQQTESADYGEIGYMAPIIGDAANGGWAPYIRAQVMAAYDADENRVPQGINSQIYGLKLGFNTAEFGFAVFGNFSPEHEGSFNDGQLLHPYTDLSGVLYTDTMNNGIQEFGPGWAAGARIDFTPTDNLAMYARYVRYQAKNGHYHDFYFNGGANNVITDDSFVGDEVNDQYSDAIGIGLTYDLGGIWKQLAGLKINDNLGITRYDEGAPNFYNNRVRVYYEF
ncbi:hypothetical protein D3260_09405 [Salinisphaera sp. Q1T1-3]|nr:hypothetical protein D3260_09405 [Salinisphaera sp. Q1T1-3]